MIVTFGDVPLTTMDSLFSVYGEFRAVGPGICGGNAAFVNLSFDGSYVTCGGSNSYVQIGSANGVVFTGANDASTINGVDLGEYA